MRAAALLLLLASCNRTPPPAAAPNSAPAKTVSAPAPEPAPPPFTRSTLPRIDVHTHIADGAVQRALQLLGQQGIVHIINLSGGGPGKFKKGRFAGQSKGLAESLAEARQAGHTTVFYNPSFQEARDGGAYGKRLQAELKEARAMGARGVKISKGLGLGYETATGQLLPVDDPGLDPFFEEAGRQKMPIAIHTGDPKAFWLPPDRNNERYDELSVHPGWSFFGAPVSWQDLYNQFERRVARHPKTIFIGVHFGNVPEDPAEVARMLDRYPNLYIDTAARIPEIGRVDSRHDAERMRAFFIKYQDRIIFGTDTAVSLDPSEMMFGSNGADPPTEKDYVRFFDSTWRWFESAQKNIPTPTPIQGRWNVDGVSLPPEVLEKVYARNAQRLLGIQNP